MPLRTNAFERLVFGSAGLGPGPMLDLLGGLAFKAVHTALEVGLFETLEPGPLDAAGLAAKTGTSERGMRFLAEALEALGYLEAHGGRYELTAMSRRWLLGSAAAPLGDLFRYFDDVLARWEHLPAAVRGGAPVLDTPAWLDESPERWRVYHAGMKAVARLLSDEILERVRLPEGARSLLDLGGSHGLHAARFCRRYPGLEATVLDLPSARSAAEATFAEEGVEGRARFVEGDFLDDDLGTGHDAVLVFNAIRALPRERAAGLLARAAAAVRPGGVVVVMDQLVERPRSHFVRANARLIDLELFASSPGDVYRAAEVSGWLVEAGLARPRELPLRRSGGQGLLVAERPQR